MKPKTEEFLNLLLWSADTLLRPAFRNLTASYESWAYRNNLPRQLARLEKLQLVEASPKASNERLYRLTEQGRLHALGGRDPEIQWSRPWDGRWRLVLFDVPAGQNARRERLRRYLRDRAFGRLQGSVWVTPDLHHVSPEILAGGKVKANSLLLLDARPCAGESDGEIVDGAWDFKRINHGYERCLEILDQRPGKPLRDGSTATALLRWAAKERDAWLAVVTRDPLLPEPLLPGDYLGRQTWQRRMEVLRQAGRQVETFTDDLS